MLAWLSFDVVTGRSYYTLHSTQLWLLTGFCELCTTIRPDGLYRIFDYNFQAVLSCLI